MNLAIFDLFVKVFYRLVLIHHCLFAMVWAIGGDPYNALSGWMSSCYLAFQWALLYVYLQTKTFLFKGFNFLSWILRG